MKYRKKSVVVEAFRLDDDIMTNWPDWVRDAIDCITDEGVVIRTLEGNHLARWGNWIIQGTQGEVYPCKSDIFNETYELAG